MSTSAYRPFRPVARPGDRPPERPRYRVLIHRQYHEVWRALPGRVGLENAQQLYDHLAMMPGAPPKVGTSSILRGNIGQPIDAGFSRTIHYEISGAGRVNYQFHDHFTGGAHGDPHPIVVILSIELASH